MVEGWDRRTESGRASLPQDSAPSPPGTAPSRLCLPMVRTGASHTFSSSTTPLTDFYSHIISMRAVCLIVTGTELTQTSASGSFKSELDLMRAYSDWTLVYTLIQKSRAVRKLNTIIGPPPWIRTTDWIFGIESRRVYH